MVLPTREVADTIGPIVDELRTLRGLIDQILVVDAASEDGTAKIAAGLGVVLDREKVAQYHERFRALGGYAYDRDPGRPGWYPLIPNHDWADARRPLGSPPLA